MGIGKGSRPLACSLSFSSLEPFFAFVKQRGVKGTGYLPVKLPGIVISEVVHTGKPLLPEALCLFCVSVCVTATPGLQG